MLLLNADDPDLLEVRTRVPRREGRNGSIAITDAGDEPGPADLTGAAIGGALGLA